MRISYWREGEKTYFMLSDLDPSAQEGARNLAFMPYKDGLAKAYPNDTPHLEVFYQQFARVAEAMVLQRARVQPVPWELALQALLQRLEGQSIHWGSVAKNFKLIKIEGVITA